MILCCFGLFAWALSLGNVHSNTFVWDSFDNFRLDFSLGVFCVASCRLSTSLGFVHMASFVWELPLRIWASRLLRLSEPTSRRQGEPPSGVRGTWRAGGCDLLRKPLSKKPSR